MNKYLGRQGLKVGFSAPDLQKRDAITAQKLWDHNAKKGDLVSVQIKLFWLYMYHIFSKRFTVFPDFSSFDILLIFSVFVFCFDTHYSFLFQTTPALTFTILVYHLQMSFFDQFSYIHFYCPLFTAVCLRLLLTILVYYLQLSFSDY